MWRYGIRKRKHDTEKREKDKQYESNCALNVLQSWLVGSMGVLKGGQPHPLDFFSK